MKLKPALVGGLIAAQFGLCAVFGLGVSSLAEDSSGKAYVTQNSSVASAVEYDTAFGDNWESVRTFRLLQRLDKPLKVYIETHPTNASLYRPHYRDYAIGALKSWSQALDGRLTFVQTQHRKEADITLDWVSSFDDKYVAGITNYSVGHASVEIKTVGIPDKDIKCNIIHEIGHALGVTGHSKDAGDIMVGVRRWRRDNTPYDPTLSSRDVQAIRRLYSASWHKGEDLYAAKAQFVPNALASNEKPQQQSTDNTTPLETASNDGQSAVKAAQSKVKGAAGQPGVQPKFRYTQIFP
ncbi:MAG: hypothetical protein K0Q50_261 [Vampirovibrio sp.]|jgi:hypothetical protein|nr:hypothetical protein [Vampirovibrio sp.]